MSLLGLQTLILSYPYVFIIKSYMFHGVRSITNNIPSEKRNQQSKCDKLDCGSHIQEHSINTLQIFFFMHIISNHGQLIPRSWRPCCKVIVFLGNFD